MFIIIGVIILAIGVFMVIKSEAMLNAFGRIEFFERHLSSDGGSRLGYKIIGLMAIFIGFLIMTNLIGGFMTWLLAPLLKYGRPQ
ncbi:hypothetical protein A3H66_03075 [Candidatus Falkowbacteria bacterium RIFCSPLOWO2_02_FULL_45_21]|uniref:DUF3784 domain-containing protein n=1 Tax=Candidatus Falkowbacteria bacterium RIFCSPLOWO2_02_FULL_45_21 TaxID=1797989 RepID=A0A1F5SCI9_9BACT|nr:MAG: hypothetical protein A3H66_03075 [Candidatus Falkowbacteria bacterium RIFCSPLOWO2_02_FULL_45_21]